MEKQCPDRAGLGYRKSHNRIISCYKEYMIYSNGRPATSREFILNMDEKMKDYSFRGDIVGLLRPNVKFDIDHAYELIKHEIVEKI